MKKLRLSARFECKCGKTFCTVHRFVDKHDCTYEHAAMARKRIALNNPTIKTIKLNLI